MNRRGGGLVLPSMRVRGWAVLVALALAGRASADDPSDGVVGVERTLAELLASPAPLRDWKTVSEATRKPGPTRRDEALIALAEDPKALPWFVTALPNEPGIWARVADLYEANRRDPIWTGRDAEHVHASLMARHPAYEADLRAAAERGPRASDGFGVDGEEPLEILQWKDPPAATRILHRLATDLDPCVRTWALVRLYGTATGEARAALHATLHALVEDPRATVYERIAAFNAVTASAWDGDVAWVLSLFHDDTLRDIQHERVHYRPLVGVVQKDPDAWIPRIVPFVGGPDRAAHDNAVQCLVAFADRESLRQDAITPLLPWVKDPGWSSADGRTSVLWRLEGIGTQADVPALVRSLEAKDPYEVLAAAKVLARLRAREAIPALRAALHRVVAATVARGDPDPPILYPEEDLLRALLDVEGMDLDEQVAHVEAFAQAGGHAPSLAALLGRMLSTSWNDGLMEKVLARAKTLEGDRPEVSRLLRSYVEQSPTATARRQMLSRLEAGAIDAEGVRSLLKDRNEVRQANAETVVRLTRGKGLACGVATALLGDADLRRAVLSEGDSEVRRAFLACARLLREPILDEVLPLLDAKDPAVARAADRFVEGDDSPKARATLWARAPSGARVLGLRPRMCNTCARDFADREEGFRREVLAEGGLDEIHALLSAGHECRADRWIVRGRGGEARVRFEPREGDAVEWTLSPGARADFLTAVRVEGADDLPAYDPVIFDGVQYEYVHVNRGGGVRVFMNNPGADDPEKDRWTDAYSRLVQAFFDLRRSRPR